MLHQITEGPVISVVFFLSIFWLDAAGACGGSWTSFTGKFTSPGYPAWYTIGPTCTYTIQSPDPQRKIQIKFDFTAISYADALEVKNSSDIVVSRLVGDVGYRTAPASSSYVAKLYRNSGYSFYGFSATWVACGGLWTTDSGSVSSPYYPSNYHNSAECTYTITPASGQKVVLQVDDFQTEVKDTVKIQDGTGDVNTTLSGTVARVAFGPATSFVIRLKSDGETSQKGFLVSWDICGGDHTTDSGSLRSPFYPDNYPNLVVCAYTISPTSGRSVLLTVVDLQTEENDTLTIRPESGIDLAILSGSVVNAAFGPAVSFTIIFTPDSETTGKGFHLSWKIAVKPPNVMTNLHGSTCHVNRIFKQISSSGLSGVYPVTSTSGSRDECLYQCVVSSACTHFSYNGSICTLLQTGPNGHPLPSLLYQKM